MKLGSLFDGSGGFPLAGSMCGVEPVWAAEVEPFPIRVTKKRFPHMKHLGDINKINGAKIEPVDIICGGSPCQGMSLAGQREGLNDHRSVLFYQMIRVIKEMYGTTNGKYPRYIVWENVIGSFSSNKGDDFRCVLEEFCRVKEPSVHIPKPKKWESAGYIRGIGYSLAWRVYDAQYWGRTITSPTGELVQRGTPQRRKRIYLVVDLAGERADRILFDREGMSGHSYQSEEQGQEVTVVAEDCIGRSSGIGINKSVAFMGGQGSNAGSLGCSADVYPTIRAAQSGSNSVPNVCYDPEWFSVNGYAEYVNKPPVLRASGGDAGGDRSSDRPIIRCMGNGQLQQITMSEICNTLDCMHDKQAILYETVYDMGCRAWLSPYKGGINNEEGKYKWYGRFNMGLTSINLADCGMSAQGNIDDFWKIFDERLELCYESLMLRYEKLKNVTSDVSPIHWQHGAIARLPKHTPIFPLLQDGYATITLGYIGVYECVKSLIGVSHTTPEGEKLALEIVKYMKSKILKWKKRTGLGFALYGTPSESLTEKFANATVRRWGTVDGEEARGFLTNSYHVFVEEKIDAFDKLKFESQFHPISSGGCISYIEAVNLTNNIPAVLAVIQYIYDNIQYAEINTKSDYCHVCGYDGEIMIDENLDWYCPNCGNKDKSKMNVVRRTCGYLGENFWNKGRTEEIKNRYVHLGAGE